jgi:ERCC4-type nuclease
VSTGRGIGRKINGKKELFILQGLPGVGHERASRILAAFGSVETASSASSSELQFVNSIGKTGADKIKWAVSERVLPYSSLCDAQANRSQVNPEFDLTYKRIIMV